MSVLLAAPLPTGKLPVVTLPSKNFIQKKTTKQSTKPVGVPAGGYLPGIDVGPNPTQSSFEATNYFQDRFGPGGQYAIGQTTPLPGSNFIKPTRPLPGNPKPVGEQLVPRGSSPT
jgi:hypothetical protein